eukprot:UN11754
MTTMKQLRNIPTTKRLGGLALLVTLTSLILYYYVSTTDECSQNPEACRDVHINIEHHDADHIHKVTDNNNPILLFLRHGIRLDKVPNDNIEWNDRKERYYDTPLSDYDLPLEIATNILNDNKLSHFKPFKMIISPYRRCIETAAIAANKFGVNTFEIDSRIGEISHDPTSGDALLPMDAHYISFDEMKNLISKHLSPDKEVEIIWNHREKPGNNQWNEALNEYKNMLTNNKHLMFVSHAGILMNCGHNSC